MTKSKHSLILKWCQRNWWIILLISIVIVTILCVWLGTDSLIAKLEITGSLANTLLTPVCLILGLILGYPLLKRRLVDGYITKQFEIIHDANREVRKRCLILRDKYTPKTISNPLNHTDILEAIDDMKGLSELAMDANDMAYKYSYLIYNTLVCFEERTRDGVNQGLNSSYVETLHTWLHYHIMQVFKYSRTIGVIPQMEVREKRFLVERLDRYVTDNKYYEVENLDGSVYYQHNSAQLVVFTALNNRYLEDSDLILHFCCYKSAPSPCPHARLMYNNSIYIPPKISGEKIFNFMERTLYLVGCKKKVSNTIPSGEESCHYICIYANISDFGFVGTINSIDDLTKYRDSYLDVDFNTEGITKLEKDGEMIRFCISEDAAMHNYECLAKKLKDKLESEI